MLKDRGVNFAGCVEKSDLVALLCKTLGCTGVAGKGDPAGKGSLVCAGCQLERSANKFGRAGRGVKAADRRCSECERFDIRLPFEPTASTATKGMLKHLVAIAEQHLGNDAYGLAASAYTSCVKALSLRTGGPSPPGMFNYTVIITRKSSRIKRKWVLFLISSTHLPLLRAPMWDLSNSG